MTLGRWIGANYLLLWVMGVCLSASFAAPLLRTKNEVQFVSFIDSEHEQACGHQVNFTTTDSCQFYASCIEQHFPCQDGFAIRYAEKRCHAILSVQGTDTFSSPHIQQWTQHHETCLRGKLLNLVHSFIINGTRPDPPVCLQLETFAFRAVEECYSETLEEFCPSNSNGLTLDLSDSLLIAQLFSLDDSYYNHTVKQGLTRLFTACNHASTDAASQALEAVAPRRAVICAIRFGNDLDVQSPLLPGTQYVKNVSEFQRIPANQLVYGQHVVYQEGGECFTSGPNYVRSGRVHLLLWSVPPEVKIDYSDYKPPLIDYYTATESLEVWSSEELQKTGECGDGVRQATEMCDTGVFSGSDYACTADCQSWEGFEWYSDRLTKHRPVMQICGDGMRTSDEECDNENGSGCDDCRIEEGWDCTSDYLRLSVCFQTPTTVPPIATNETTSPQPTPTIPTLSTPSIRVPDSAGMASTHLVLVVVSVLIALVVSSGLTSALPGSGDAGSGETLHITSTHWHGQRKKPSEVLDASARPCRSDAQDCITRCMPHEGTMVPLTTE